MAELVHALEVGLGKNLTYLIVDPSSQSAAVVDPAFEGDRILRWARDLGAKITHVLVTHTHPDHVEAVGMVASQCDARVHVHQVEAHKLPDDVEKSRIVPHDGRPDLMLGDTRIAGLHTPGHTPGGTSFLVGEAVITGDVLFVHGCGRADLPGGDVDQLFHSLYEVLLELPPETVLHPGHDYGPRPVSTLWDEARNNPYLKFRGDQEGFRHFRMNSRMGRLIPKQGA